MSRKATIADTSTNLHATCVAFGARALLITGKSGTGKSALGLQLIALGATLISDDLTQITLVEGAPVAHAPKRLAGIIEARKVGLLRVPFQKSACVHLWVNLDKIEQDRLPHHHVTHLLGVDIPTIYKVNETYFAAALAQLAEGGRTA